METDIEVDFAPPLDYEEPASTASAAAEAETPAGSGGAEAQTNGTPEEKSGDSGESYWGQLSGSGRSIRGSRNSEAASSSGASTSGISSSAPVQQSKGSASLASSAPSSSKSGGKPKKKVRSSAVGSMDGCLTGVCD